MIGVDGAAALGFDADRESIELALPLDGTVVEVTATFRGSYAQ